MKNITCVCVLMLFGCSGNVRQSNDDKLEVLLTKICVGMSIDELNKKIGMRGECDPNPPPDEMTYRYDFDGYQLIVIAKSPIDHGLVIKEIFIMNDGLKIEARKEKQDKEWQEWVNRHPVPTHK